MRLKLAVYSIGNQERKPAGTHASQCKRLIMTIQSFAQFFIFLEN